MAHQPNYPNDSTEMDPFEAAWELEHECNKKENSPIENIPLAKPIKEKTKKKKYKSRFGSFIVMSHLCCWGGSLFFYNFHLTNAERVRAADWAMNRAHVAPDGSWIYQWFLLWLGLAFLSHMAIRVEATIHQTLRDT